MSIFSRLRDIVNSNIVNMLDKAEDPEKMVRFMIQEMEDTLIEVKSSAAKMISEKVNLEEKISITENNESEWLKRAELAIEKNRDDLAKGALIEKNKCAELKESLVKELDSINNAFASFKSDINALEEKLLAAKAKQKAIIARKKTAISRMEIRDNLHKANSNSAFLKFDKFEKNIENMEAEVEAKGLPYSSSPLDDEFVKLEQESKVEKELLSLKKQLKSSVGEKQ